MHFPSQQVAPGAQAGRQAPAPVAKITAPELLAAGASEPLLRPQADSASVSRTSTGVALSCNLGTAADKLLPSVPYREAARSSG
jgi:hypothetical protein